MYLLYNYLKKNVDYVKLLRLMLTQWKIYSLCNGIEQYKPKIKKYIYRNEPMEILPGAWGFLLMHPMGAQNKSLISNTDLPFRISKII